MDWTLELIPRQVHAVRTWVGDGSATHGSPTKVGEVEGGVEVVAPPGEEQEGQGSSGRVDGESKEGVQGRMGHAGMEAVVRCLLSSMPSEYLHV